MTKFYSVPLCIFLLTFCIHTNAQNDVNRRVTELKKMVSISIEQEHKAKILAERYFSQVDSALYKVDDKFKASKALADAKKEYNESLLKLLTLKQQKEYIRVTTTQEITDKTEAKINMLRKSKRYSEQDLEKFRREIFEYFMQEKVIYVREKYNNEKLKENISQLKKYEPVSLKVANELQKMKHQGKMYQNGYIW